MAWTQDDLDKLDGAIKKGARRVTYNASGTVEYHSLDEMLKLRTIMQTEVGGMAAPKTTVGAYCSGLQGSQIYPTFRRRW